jgi:hypothetical protein
MHGLQGSRGSNWRTHRLMRQTFRQCKSTAFRRVCGDEQVCGVAEQNSQGSGLGLVDRKSKESERATARFFEHQRCRQLVRLSRRRQNFSGLGLAEGVAAVRFRAHRLLPLPFPHRPRRTMPSRHRGQFALPSANPSGCTQAMSALRV